MNLNLFMFPKSIFRSNFILIIPYFFLEFGPFHTDHEFYELPEIPIEIDDLPEIPIEIGHEEEEESVIGDQNLSTDQDISDQMISMSKQIYDMRKMLAEKDEQNKKLTAENKKLQTVWKSMKNLKRVKNYYRTQCKIMKPKIRMLQKQSVIDKVRRDKTVGANVKNLVEILFKKR